MEFFAKPSDFIRLRRNTLRLAAGMTRKANRAEARQSDPGCAGGFAEARGGFLATAKFRFDTPPARS